MQTFEVVLTKSYLIKIKTDNMEMARRYTELFTGDIQDISTSEDRKKFKFIIEDIECKLNEALEVVEIER